jgi:glutaredoxin 3
LLGGHVQGRKVAPTRQGRRVVNGTSTERRKTTLRALAASDKSRETMIATVKVYTTRICGYCALAKALLTKRGVPFEEVDVTRDEAQRTWLVKATGQKTVPQIFIDGEPIGGSDELHELDASGELEKLLHR